MGTKRILLFILGLALAAIPASATISYCASGCNDVGTSYASMPSSNDNGGLTYTTGDAFTSLNLSGSPAIYTDPTTGLVLYGYNNTTADSLNVSGSNLTQSTSGTGTSIQSVLPANTYAIAMVVGASAFSNTFIELASSPSSLNTGTNDLFQLFITGGTSQFFGIVSDTPIASVFVWTQSPTTLNIQSFEVGDESGGGATPEPSTFWMIGGGFIGLSFLRRRRVGAPQ